MATVAITSGSTSADTTVLRATEDSIREDRTVELMARVDTQEWVDLAQSLSAACDDWSEEADEIGVRRLYWGADEDGDEWQIRLIGRDQARA